jgi:uncharacterized protein YkwD
MTIKTFNIIFFLIILCLSDVKGQRASAKINPDSINNNFLESLIKKRIDSVRLVNKRDTLEENDTLKKAIIDQVNYVCKNKQLTHFQTGNEEKNSVSDRVSYFGMKFTYVGENLVCTYLFTKISNRKGGIYMNTTYNEAANDIVNLWVKSKGHFKNVIDEEYTKTAVAVHYDAKTKTIYAGQVFSSNK